MRRLLVSMFLASLAMGMAGLALPLYLAIDLDASYIEIGLLGVTYVIFDALLSLPSGTLADRYGRRLFLALGFFTTACVLGAYSLVGVISLVLVLRLIQGAAEAPIWVNAQAATADLSPPTKRGRAMGIYATSWATGFAIGPLIGGFLYQSVGAAITFQASALLAFAATAVFVTMRLPKPKITRQKPMLRELLPVCRIGLIYISMVSVIFILFPVYVSNPPFSMTPFDIGLLLTLFMGIRAVLFTSLGGLSDRFGPRPVIMGGLLGSVAAFIGLAFVTDYLGLALMLAFLALASGAIYPAVMSMVTQVGGGENRGYVLGIFNGISVLGWGIMPGIGGVLANAFGPTSPYLACALLAALGFLLVRKIR